MEVSEEVADYIFRVTFCTEHWSGRFLQNSCTCTKLCNITLHKIAIKKKSLPTIAFAQTKYARQFCVFMISKTPRILLGSTQPPICGKWASCSGCKAASAGSLPLTPVSSEARNKWSFISTSARAFEVCVGTPVPHLHHYHQHHWNYIYFLVYIFKVKNKFH